MTHPLLSVEALRTSFDTHDGELVAVDGVSFTLNAGETLGLVGESGCGKSMTAKSVLRLVRPPGRITQGRVMLGGRDLLALSEGQMREVRGNEMAMIFQEPIPALNPVYTVGFQLVETIRQHQRIGHARAEVWATEMLRRVGISTPEQRLRAYPHQLSGGMCQRVLIAMALACNPKVLIADEPTTALDATIQAQILELMKALRESTGMAIVLITHDLGVVADMCDRVAVMYAGRVVEAGPVWSIFERPRHPYTEGLLHSIPMLGHRRQRLHVIPGNVPNPLRWPSGCRFHTRCPYVTEACRHEEPALQPVDGAWVACLRAEQIVTRGVV